LLENLLNAKPYLSTNIDKLVAKKIAKDYLPMVLSAIKEKEKQFVSNKKN
jgi:hypothetical protein